MISAQTMHEIEQLIFRYSFAMDMRRWDEMDAVFLAEACIIMGDQIYPTRVDGVNAIRGYIEYCSQTHHMNSNILVLEASKDRIRTVTNFRAFHRGRGARAEEVLECLGTYIDEFRRNAEGWRIARRQEDSPIVIGDIMHFFSGVLPGGDATNVVAGA